jgi:uncharacterized protein involved in exopolysaccharide biosynthesis
MDMVIGVVLMSHSSGERILLDPVRTQRIVWRVRWLVVLAALAGAALGYYAVRMELGTQTTYSSSVDLQLFPTAVELQFARDTLGGTPTAQARSFVRTSIEVLTSDAVISTAVSNVSGSPGVKLSGVTVADDIRDAISVDQIDGSFILRVTVSMRDAALAAELAEALVVAYDLERSLLENRAAERLDLAYAQKIMDITEAYSNLVERELDTRRDIGALTLDAEIAQRESDLEVQSSGLFEDQISLAVIKRSGNAAPSATSTQTSLEARIEERELIIDMLRKDLAEAARKQATLQPLIAEQELVLETIAELTSARLGISTRQIAGPSETIILRNRGVATMSDPPTPVQAAFFGGVAGFMLASTLTLLFAVMAPPPREHPGET